MTAQQTHASHLMKLPLATNAGWNLTSLVEVKNRLHPNTQQYTVRRKSVTVIMTLTGNKAKHHITILTTH